MDHHYFVTYHRRHWRDWAEAIIMGVPNTVSECTNCGEPVIQYNNTGPWKHYPEHPFNRPATDCMMPHVLAADRVTPAIALTKKTAVNR